MLARLTPAFAFSEETLLSQPEKIDCNRKHVQMGDGHTVTRNGWKLPTATTTTPLERPTAAVLTTLA